MKRAFFLAAAVFATACAPKPMLIPDPGVQSGDFGATGEQAGVRVFVNGAMWRGQPASLWKVLTPVSVRIENRSGKALRVAYGDFALVGASGFRYAAVAPLSGNNAPTSGLEEKSPGVVPAAYHPATPPRRPRPAPRFYHRHFYVAPHYRYFYPGFRTWPHPYYYDPFYYQRYSWAPPLPSEDMLSEALPEGALADEGHVQGFLYFQPVTQRESQVRFEMTLVDADSGDTFGKVELPFTVRGS